MLSAARPILCRGSHETMGEQQGVATAQAIEGVYRAFLNGPELELSRPRWLPKLLFQRIARFKARRALESSLTAQYPDQVARMRGIARGAGIGMDMLYLGLAAELELNRVEYLPGACSAVAVAGARSATGDPLIGKNFDYPAPFRVGFCVRRNQPDRGLRSIDVTVGPLAGCHSGVNEAGLAVTYNYGYGQDRGDAVAPISLLVQRILERCTTVAEAEALIRETPRAGGAILLSADAGGDMAALEVSPTRLGVRRGEGVVACSNHYLDPHMVEVDVPRDAVYGAGSLPQLRGLRVNESSEARLTELERLTAGEAAMGAEDLQAVLSNHGVDDRGTDHTLCRHGDYYETTAAVVLLPAERKLQVVFGRPCEQRFVTHTVDAAPEPRAARPLPTAR